jgi:peptide/nickel transport system substrate-binding protein
MHFFQQSKHFPPAGLWGRMSRISGVLLCLLAILLAGCDSPEPGASPKAQAQVVSGREDGQPVHGGRLVMATGGEPSNLIPPLATDASSHDVASLLYVSPLRYDKDIKIEPYAAESFEILDGGKHLVFRLRRDIRWFDGEPLTAADVEFTYKLMIDPETPTAYAGDFQEVKEFRLTGPYSFEVFYDKPFAKALSTWTAEILPKHALMGQDLRTTRFARQPLGAGPYRLTEWVENQRLILTANPDYFEGKPYIDEVIFRTVPDQTTQFLELKAGNLDYIGLTPPQYLFQTNGTAWEENFHKYRYLASSYTYLGYNLEHPLFKDRLVRQALARAIDKREIVKGALLGMGEPTIGPYKPDSWAYDRDIKDWEYDPGRAIMLLASLGWKRETPAGPLMKDGKPFAFTIITNQGNDQRIKTCAILQNQLARIGIQVKVRTIEWAAFIKEFIDQRRFEAVVLGWTVGQDPDVYDVWHSSRIAAPGLNFMGYANPEVDALLEEGRSLLDPVQRKPVYDRFQDILKEDQPYCFLYTPYALPIVAARVRGVEPAPAGIFWNFNSWWIPASQQRTTYSQ